MQAIIQVVHKGKRTRSIDFYKKLKGSVEGFLKRLCIDDFITPSQSNLLGFASTNADQSTGSGIAYSQRTYCRMSRGVVAIHQMGLESVYGGRIANLTKCTGRFIT